MKVEKSELISLWFSTFGRIGSHSYFCLKCVLCNFRRKKIMLSRLTSIKYQAAHYHLDSKALVRKIYCGTYKALE